MKFLKALLCFSIFGIFVSTNWRCVENLPLLKINIDSLNNALLFSVDAFSTVTADDFMSIQEVGYCWNTTGAPTVQDSLRSLGKPQIVKIEGTVESFSPGKTYFIRAFVRSVSDLAYSEEKTFSTWGGKASDADGNIYTGTQIGNQGWLAENLRSTRYSNGLPIDIGNASNRTYWYGSQHKFVPNFDDDIDGDGDLDAQDSILFVQEYGLLYSWFAAANIYDHQNVPALLDKKVYTAVRDVCPKGFHLPSDRDFQDLRNFLTTKHGPDGYAHHLTTKSGWLDGLNGLDTYRFGLKPSAYWHEPDATHSNILGRVAFLWGSDNINDANAFYLQTDNLDKKFVTGIIGKSQHALCVRCLKDK